MAGKLRISRIAEAAERVQVAHLLYEGDKPFVPITPLTILRESSTFFKAQLDTDRSSIRAASSYELWLAGCDDERAAGPEIAVFELASSIVHDPLGGFQAPSLQQVFAFVRLLDMLYAYTRANDSGELCVIAAIATANTKSMTGMTELGMEPIEDLPRWMDYEHRGWFPRLENKEARQVEAEARYLWLPPEAAKALFELLAPFVDRQQYLKRSGKKGTPEEGTTQEYELDVDIGPVRDLLAENNSMAAAIAQFPFQILRPPPKYALLEGQTF
jgi:hypothetical protein